MCGLIALAFIVVTAAEVVLLIEVGSVLGAIPTFGIIVVTGLVGAYLARREGAAAMLRLRESMLDGGTSLALVDGALVLAAGVTLLSPGFITDACGLLLLVRPIRGVVSIWLLGVIRRRAERGGDMVTTESFGSPFGSSFGAPFGDDRGEDEDPPPPGVIDV